MRQKKILIAVSVGHLDGIYFQFFNLIKIILLYTVLWAISEGKWWTWKSISIYGTDARKFFWGKMHAYTNTCTQRKIDYILKFRPRTKGKIIPRIKSRYTYKQCIPCCGFCIFTSIFNQILFKFEVNRNMPTNVCFHHQKEIGLRT